MARKKTDVNAKEVGGLLKGTAMRADITRRVRAIAAAAGPGFTPSVVVGRTRIRGSVITSTQAARQAEATTRALSRALDAGRG